MQKNSEISTKFVINTHRMFKDGKTSIASVKNISAIIGKCWEGSYRNKDIADFFPWMSEETASQCLKHFLRPSKVIEYEFGPSEEKLNTIDFHRLILYLIEFSKIDLLENEKNEIVQTVIEHKEIIGKAFLTSFIHKETEIYDEGMNKIKKLFEIVPEYIFYLILQLDFKAQKSTNYARFLSGLLNGIMEEIDSEYPVLGNIWKAIIGPLKHQIEQTIKENSKENVLTVEYNLTITKESVKKYRSLLYDPFHYKVMNEVFLKYLQDKDFRYMISLIMRGDFVVLVYDPRKKKNIQWKFGENANALLDNFLEVMCKKK